MGSSSTKKKPTKIIEIKEEKKEEVEDLEEINIIVEKSQELLKKRKNL